MIKGAFTSTANLARVGLRDSFGECLVKFCETRRHTQALFSES